MTNFFDHLYTIKEEVETINTFNPDQSKQHESMLDIVLRRQDAKRLAQDNLLNTEIQPAASKRCLLPNSMSQIEENQSICLFQTTSSSETRHHYSKNTSNTRLYDLDQDSFNIIATFLHRHHSSCVGRLWTSGCTKLMRLVSNSTTHIQFSGIVRRNPETHEAHPITQWGGIAKIFPKLLHVSLPASIMSLLKAPIATFLPHTLRHLKCIRHIRSAKSQKIVNLEMEKFMRLIFSSSKSISTLVNLLSLEIIVYNSSGRWCEISMPNISRTTPILESFSVLDEKRSYSYDILFLINSTKRLPLSLTSLKACVDISKHLRPNQWKDVLPANLIDLSMICFTTSKDVKTLSQMSTIWPKSLTSIGVCVRTPQDELKIASLPSSVTDLTINSYHAISNAVIYPPNLTRFSYESLHQAPSMFEIINPSRLPTTLTHLKIVTTPHTFIPIITNEWILQLPNSLTRLDLGPYSSIRLDQLSFLPRGLKRIDSIDIDELVHMRCCNIDANLLQKFWCSLQNMPNMTHPGPIFYCPKGPLNSTVEMCQLPTHLAELVLDCNFNETFFKNESQWKELFLSLPKTLERMFLHHSYEGVLPLYYLKQSTPKLRKLTINHTLGLDLFQPLLLPVSLEKFELLYYTNPNWKDLSNLVNLRHLAVYQNSNKKYIKLDAVRMRHFPRSLHSLELKNINISRNAWQYLPTSLSNFNLMTDSLTSFNLLQLAQLAPPSGLVVDVRSKTWIPCEHSFKDAIKVLSFSRHLKQAMILFENCENIEGLFKDDDNLWAQTRLVKLLHLNYEPTVVGVEIVSTRQEQFVRM